MCEPVTSYPRTSCEFIHKRRANRTCGLISGLDPMTASCLSELPSRFDPYLALSALAQGLATAQFEKEAQHVPPILA